MTVKMLAAIVIALVVLPVVVWTVGRPRQPASSPLTLQPVVDPDSSGRSPEGRVLFEGFRVVESSVLYAARGLQTDNAFADGALFDVLRSRNITRIVSLGEDAGRFYAEEGYLRYWGERTGYHVSAVWIAVRDSHLFDRDNESGLHAAAELLALMKDAPQGATLVHDEVRGADATGIAVAAYELWRNWSWIEADTLWRQVTERYLTWQGARGAEFEGLRRDLETLAEL
jgi:hypothetical protein